jgi:hypothetical protein
MRQQWFSQADLEDMIRAGTITDAPHDRRLPALPVL